MDGINYHAVNYAEIINGHRFEDTVFGLYGGIRHPRIYYGGTYTIPDIVRKQDGHWEAIEIKSVGYGSLKSTAIYKLRNQIAFRARAFNRNNAIVTQRIVFEDYGYDAETKKDIIDFVHSYLDPFYYKIPIDFVRDNN